VAKYKEAKAMGKSVWVELKGTWHELKFHVLYKAGVDYVFIEHMAFQRPGTPYGDHSGPFKDNLFRCVAALNASTPISKRHVWCRLLMGLGARSAIGLWQHVYGGPARRACLHTTAPMLLQLISQSTVHCTAAAAAVACRFALMCLGGLEAPLNLPIKRDR
jgi:hypothetical protein